jgi:hypothetical protein
MQSMSLRKSGVVSLLVSLLACGAAAAADVSGNIAPKARVSASLAYSDGYQATNLVDGQIPAPMSRDDEGKAWCAGGNGHRDGVTIAFEWPGPVTVATVVYYGRTAFEWGENFKDYEITLDGAAEPVAKGKLKPGHGPQPVNLPKPATTKKLVFKLLTNYGGPNPGASEIQVFSKPIAAASLGKFVKPYGNMPFAPPVLLEDSPELAAKLKAGKLGFTKLLVIERNLIQASHVYTYHCEGQKDGGGLYLYDVTNGELTELVPSPGGQILDCDLSFDARKILFSWRRGKLYQVYSINVDGTGLTQLTDDESHNFNACWLPDGDVLFLSTRRPQAAYCFFTPVGILYRMEADGSNQRRISSNYLNDFTPAVMDDGRVIYGRWEYVDRPAIPIQSLWTINPDGTALAGFYGNRVLGPATFIEPQSIPGRPEILCTMTGHNGFCAGAIGLIDVRRGDNAQEAIRNITPEINHGTIDRSNNGTRGPYQTPYPIGDTYFLVSHNGSVLVRDYEQTEQATVLETRGLGFRNARPVRPRPTPPVRSSHLPDPEETGPWATMFLQDVYQGLLPHVERGEVKQIAVVQERARTLMSSPGIHRPAFDFQRILVSCGATYVPKKVWGFADVAADGSAHFKVPAEQPVYFIALDDQGRAVQRMRSFTHLMPGEVQGCIGCHEPRNQTSHVQLPTAVLGQPQELTVPEWGVRGFCYASIVQPVLDKHCVECHQPHDKQGDIDLTGDRTDYFNVSYEVLARRNQGRRGSPWVNWIPTYNGHEWNIHEITPKAWGSPQSKLADLILSGHPDAEGKPRVKMDEASRRRVLMWIDLNVPYYGTADTAHHNRPACRQLLPAELQKVMDDVYARRCQKCHDEKEDRALMTWRPTGWGGMGVRIENPERNDFLLAPLAKSAGGTGRCGQPVFRSKDDPDYQAVLKTFAPIHGLMRETPRMDMPGAVPADCCPRLDLTAR